MYKTHVRPVRDIRNNYAELDKIVNNHDHVIITNNGRGTAALIGIEEYARYELFLRSMFPINQSDERSSEPKPGPITGVIPKDPSKRLLSRAETFGCMRGKITMSDDFDEPLDDFGEYM